MKKGYRKTDVGVIPEDWVAKQLGSLGKFRGGSGFPTKYQGDIEGDYPFFKVSDMNNEGNSTFMINSNNWISENTRKQIGANTFPANTIVFAKIGAAIFLERKKILSQESCIDNNMMGFVLDDGTAHHRFVHYLFLSIQLGKLVAATALPSLNGRDIAGLAYGIPKLPEQTAIAAVLSDADALIISLEKLITKKRNIKQGAMQELLMPKEGWVMKKLGEIFTFSGGYSASREQLSNDGFCYLHYGDIHGAKKTFINVKNEYTEIPKLKILLKNVSPKSLLSNGDIVFVDASEDDEGTSRHIVVKNTDGIPYISGLHTIVAKSKDNSLDNDFKRYCFQTKVVKSQFKFYAVGTKVSGISKANIAKIEIAIPSKAEQTRIATILTNMDTEIEVLKQKLAKYRMIKQGMMQELLTGKTRLI